MLGYVEFSLGAKRTQQRTGIAAILQREKMGNLRLFHALSLWCVSTQNVHRKVQSKNNRCSPDMHPQGRKWPPRERYLSLLVKGEAKKVDKGACNLVWGRNVLNRKRFLRRRGAI